jgi:phosphotransferase system, enzyme I, PtsP
MKIMGKRKGQLNLLCDIGDLSALLSESVDIEIFLQRTVRLVAQNLRADVCSIYLFDIQADQLVLKATIGLNPEAVNKVHLKVGEGLVGLTLEQLQPICEAKATLNPHYRYFEETHEDRFESFLAVPIRRGVERIGVLVVQHEQENYFDEYDVMTLRVIASQLAGAMENARLLIDMNQPARMRKFNAISDRAEFIKGNPASGGYAFANAAVMKKSHGGLMTGYEDKEKEYSLKDFFVSLEKTTHQLESFQAKLAQRLPESASLIFTAHFMILKDAKFIDKIVDMIEKGVSPPEAVRSVTRDYVSIFLSSSHAYIREKANDMEDLAGRILKNLYYADESEHEHGKGRIIIARDLFPSEMLKLATEDVKGIILVSGGITSHVAILSRSMKIPLVIAERPDLLDIPDGVPILLDADIGNIFVRPSDKIVQQYETRNKTQQVVAPLKGKRPELTKTLDRHRIRLMANINLLSELALAKDLNAEGVGLYRTEFPFLIRTNFPSEEEQYLVYKQLFDVMAGKEVTIRTLDVGGDKVLVYSDSTNESNPELGLRSIRFSLTYLDVFEQQVRAILRAAPPGESLKIMFPMISSVDEFREARQMVNECIDDLKCAGIGHHPKPKIGAMLEIPSVVEIMSELAQEADFFSIGTNDFVQYMLAVDRTNEKVASYYRPFHPSVLRAMERMVLWAKTWGKDISVCGEMAHEPEFIPFLLGIGIRSLSVDPQFIVSVQEQIAKLKLNDAEAYAKELLSQFTIQGAWKILQSYPPNDRYQR